MGLQHQAVAELSFVVTRRRWRWPTCQQVRFHTHTPVPRLPSPCQDKLRPALRKNGRSLLDGSLAGSVAGDYVSAPGSYELRFDSGNGTPEGAVKIGLTVTGAQKVIEPFPTV